MFEIRYNILVNYVDYFVICESKYDHAGKQKKQNFLFMRLINNMCIFYYIFKYRVFNIPGKTILFSKC